MWVDSGDIEEGGVRSSMAVTPFETIQEEPASSGPSGGERQSAPSDPTEEVIDIAIEEPESQMKPASSASHLVGGDDDDGDEEEGVTPLADRRRGLLSFLKGKGPEVAGGSRATDSSSEDVTI